jgi:hypothetical protein
VHMQAIKTCSAGPNGSVSRTNKWCRLGSFADPEGYKSVASLLAENIFIG